MSEKPPTSEKNQSPYDWMSAANKKAKGKRPQYFDDSQDDVILSILMSLVGEVSVLRERLDTIERLLESKETLTRADIESYVPDKIAAHERGEMIREYIFRIMRGPQQSLQAMEQSEKPLEEVSKELINNT